VSHILAHSHNLKFQGNPIFQTGLSDFDRFDFHGQRTPMMEIGPTSTQVASGRGKVRTVANLGASGGEDG
jgi:hypothetical protein